MLVFKPKKRKFIKDATFKEYMKEQLNVVKPMDSNKTDFKNNDSSRITPNHEEIKACKQANERQKGSSFKRKFNENKKQKEKNLDIKSGLSSNNSTIGAAGSMIPMNDNKNYKLIREEPQVRLEDFKDTEIIDIELPEDHSEYNINWVDE